jgi:hypothetical protein
MYTSKRAPLIKVFAALGLCFGGTVYSPASFAIDGDLTVASIESARSFSNLQTNLNPEQVTYLGQSPISSDQYRVRAAQHIYKLNKAKVYAGRMPPLLKAIGVVEIQLTPNGDIKNLKWSRPPSHVPEVMQEIERTLRSAAPYPISPKGEAVVFTETWLWHKSDRFQLLSLTEGQD